MLVCNGIITHGRLADRVNFHCRSNYLGSKLVVVNASRNVGCTLKRYPRLIVQCKKKKIKKKASDQFAANKEDAAGSMSDYLQFGAMLGYSADETLTHLETKYTGLELDQEAQEIRQKLRVKEQKQQKLSRVMDDILNKDYSPQDGNGDDGSITPFWAKYAHKYPRKEMNLEDIGDNDLDIMYGMVDASYDILDDEAEIPENFSYEDFEDMISQLESKNLLDEASDYPPPKPMPSQPSYLFEEELEPQPELPTPELNSKPQFTADRMLFEEMLAQEIQTAEEDYSQFESVLNEAYSGVESGEAPKLNKPVGRVQPVVEENDVDEQDAVDYSQFEDALKEAYSDPGKGPKINKPGARLQPVLEDDDVVEQDAVDYSQFEDALKEAYSDAGKEPKLNKPGGRVEPSVAEEDTVEIPEPVELSKKPGRKIVSTEKVTSQSVEEDLEVPGKVEKPVSRKNRKKKKSVVVETEAERKPTESTAVESDELEKESVVELSKPPLEKPTPKVEETTPKVEKLTAVVSKPVKPARKNKKKKKQTVDVKITSKAPSPSVVDQTDVAVESQPEKKVERRVEEAKEKLVPEEDRSGSREEAVALDQRPELKAPPVSRDVQKPKDKKAIVSVAEPKKSEEKSERETEEIALPTVQESTGPEVESDTTAGVRPDVQEEVLEASSRDAVESGVEERSDAVPLSKPVRPDKDALMKIMFDAQLSRLNQLQQNRQVVKVTAARCNAGGVVVKGDGILFGFLPFKLMCKAHKELVLEKSEELAKKMNPKDGRGRSAVRKRAMQVLRKKTFSVKLMNIDETKKTAIFCDKDNPMLDESQIKRLTYLMTNNIVVKGKVRRTTEHGVFVDFGLKQQDSAPVEITGLIPKRDLSPEALEPDSKMLEEGAEISMKIRLVDTKTKRVFFTMRNLDKNWAGKTFNAGALLPLSSGIAKENRAMARKDLRNELGNIPEVERFCERLEDQEDMLDVAMGKRLKVSSAVPDFRVLLSREREVLKSGAKEYKLIGRLGVELQEITVTSTCEWKDFRSVVLQTVEST